MSTAGVTDSTVMSSRHAVGGRHRVRRTPVTWVRRGGLTTLLFLAPMLLVFGAFSWYPIVRTVIMSLQHTNLVQPATWVGFANFGTVIHDQDTHDNAPGPGACASGRAAPIGAFGNHR